VDFEIRFGLVKVGAAQEEDKLLEHEDTYPADYDVAIQEETGGIL
jgi:hypothetical protein